jgi:hypothetical protein
MDATQNLAQNIHNYSQFGGPCRFNGIMLSLFMEIPASRQFRTLLSTPQHNRPFKILGPYVVLVVRCTAFNKLFLFANVKLMWLT